MTYEHVNKKGQKYYLHSKAVTLRGSGKKQTIYFFARDKRSGSMDQLPTGFMVKEVERTGLPILKRK